MFVKLLKFLKYIFSPRPVRGNILLFVIIFGSIALSVIIGGIAGYAIMENRAAAREHNREQAFQIAEAGINYYRWHLAHANNDFADGTGESGPGPFVHSYTDKDGNAIGYFSLMIYANPVSSTVVTIESTGWLANQPESKRTIKARVGFPSLADYAFLSNTDVWIGDSEITHGKFHANGGIRFDGVGDAPITSAMATYTCKTHHGCGNSIKPGIWGDGTPNTYWQFPLPAEDFSAITAKLAQIKDKADPDAGGIYLTSSGAEGWRIQFVDDGTVNIYKVLSTNCYSGLDVSSTKYQSFCIDIKTIGSATSYNMPANGYIYVEDTVWVDGVVNGRVVVGTAVDKNIIINGNITYLAKDGNHVLGLIAEKDILIPHDSADDLEIDAALLAQTGACKRYYYHNNRKDNLLIYGLVISAKIWTWSWLAGNSGEVNNGYANTVSTYDANLTYSPPPGFPVGSEYNLISWEEVR